MIWCKRGGSGEVNLLEQAGGRQRVFLKTALPLFAIPSTVAETSGGFFDEENESVEWTLDAKASLRGVDYYSSFKVPVFKKKG